MTEALAAISRPRTSDERAGLEASVASARSEGRTRFVAHVTAAPVPEALECYARGDRAGIGQGDRFLWEPGSGSRFAVAFGTSDETESAGIDRFRDLRAWSSELRERVDWIGDPRPKASPLLFGGFSFEDESPISDEWKAFPAARFVMPETLVERHTQGSGFVSIVRVEPGSRLESIEADLEVRAATIRALLESAARESALATPPHELEGVWPDGPEFRVRADRPHAVFRGQVEAALDAFRTGDLSKVVLARSLSVDHDGRIDVPAFLARLRSLYPTCTLVAVGRGEDTFLAATPETLVRVEGREVATAALAGSAPRGRHPEEDRAYADRLLSSVKERAEHAHVVDAIRSTLAPLCEPLDVPGRPRLLPLFGIQHLETPIRGRLADPDLGILDLAERMHPTPAVGGVPSAAARSWLTRNERLERGWYASPIGWLDLEGGGDLRVALRSGLIRNGIGLPGESGASRSLLYAGAGLVDGSEPEQELLETRIKLRALLAPLTEI